MSIYDSDQCTNISVKADNNAIDLYYGTRKIDTNIHLWLDGQMLLSPTSTNSRATADYVVNRSHRYLRCECIKLRCELFGYVNINIDL